jgi:hypothetical protein
VGDPVAHGAGADYGYMCHIWCLFGVDRKYGFYSLRKKTKAASEMETAFIAGQ